MWLIPWNEIPFKELVNNLLHYKLLVEKWTVNLLKHYTIIKRKLVHFTEEHTNTLCLMFMKFNLFVSILF